MSVPVIHSTSIEGCEVQTFVMITNESWVEIYVILDFHGGYPFF